jgi:hypothetical protein
LIKLVKEQKAVRQWNKARVMQVWRERARRWRVLERVLRGQARRAKERGYRKWVRWAMAHRAKDSKTGLLQGLSLLANFFARGELKSKMQAMKKITYIPRMSPASLFRTLESFRKSRLQHAFKAMQIQAKQRGHELDKAGHFKQF